MDYMIYQEEKAKINGFEIPVQCISAKLPKIDHDGMLHYHDYVEILYGINCDAVISMPEKNFTLKNGDMLIVPSKKPHTVVSPTQESTYIVLKIMPQILYASEQSVLELKYIMPFVTDDDRYRKLFPKKDIENGEIPNLIRNMLKEWAEKNYGYEIALRAYAIKILLWFVRKWHVENPELDYNFIDESDDVIRCIQKSMEYAQREFATATSLEAAQLCNLSYSYFSRVFKKIMRKSFTEYVNHVRISESQRMLISTDKSVTDIALDIGFSTTSYFIDKFKKQVQITPMQFRKKYNIDTKEEEEIT